MIGQQTLNHCRIDKLLHRARQKQRGDQQPGTKFQQIIHHCVPPFRRYARAWGKVAGVRALRGRFFAWAAANPYGLSPKPLYMAKVPPEPRMSNRLALIIAFVILAAIALDFAMLQGAASLFLARRILVLIDWAMFWR